MSSQRPDKLRDGQEVIGVEGNRVGLVQEIHAFDFLVTRPNAPEVHIPFSAIQDISDRQVMLNIPANDIDKQDWAHI